MRERKRDREKARGGGKLERERNKNERASQQSERQSDRVLGKELEGERGETVGRDEVGHLFESIRCGGPCLLHRVKRQQVKLPA